MTRIAVSAPPPRSRLRRAAAVAVALTVVLGACATSWPDEPKPYIPSKVGGQPVETKGDVPSQFTQALGESSKASAAGTVGKNCEGVSDFPELTLVALQAKSKKDTSDASLADLMKSLGGDSGVQQATKTLHGVKTYTLRLNNDDPRSGLSLAVAHPPDTSIILYSVAYCGGIDKATQGMNAMLSSAAH